MQVYDVVIVGAGPAGLTAALYASRYKLKTLVIGAEAGGQLNYAYHIENYPGFDKIDGREFIKKIRNQVKKLKVEIVEKDVAGIIKEKNLFKVIGEGNCFNYYSKTIILALGTQRKKLNLPQEDKFIGKGISYCATCDGALFKNKTVAIVGGSNSAVMDALLLLRYVKKLYIVYRGKELRAEPLRVEQVKKNKKTEIIYNAEVKSINGKNLVESVGLSNGRRLKVDGLFIDVGAAPQTFLIKRLNIKLDNQGYILVNKDMETNVSGVYAAGDGISKKLRQLVNACGDGAIAAFSAYLYLQKKK